RRGHPQPGQAVDQDVALLHDAVAVAEAWLEEGADPRLDQHDPAAVVDEEAPTGQGDAVVLVGLYPARPERLRHVAEHGAAVQALAVAVHGGQGAHSSVINLPSRGRARPRRETGGAPA